MTFKEFKQKFQDNFKAIDGKQLFIADVSKDELWKTWLASFPEEIRQEYNCNCCRQFIKNYGGLVFINDQNEIDTIWNFRASDEFEKVPYLMQTLVSNVPIANIFVTDTNKWGVNRNAALINGTIDTWEHMYLEPKYSYLKPSTATSIEAVQGERRTAKEVFKRALDEITLDSIQTVLELIDQNSLYRGAEYKALLEGFLKLKKEYVKLEDSLKDNFAWRNSSNDAVSRVRSTAIGTLLIDISEGRELDSAVTAFERIMAPVNYKRPKAIITKSMIEAAEKQIAELGYEDSLGRRFATNTDISVNDVLFVDRNKVSLGILGVLADDIAVNPKSLTKVEEVSVKDFVEKILPKVNTVELLVENRHQANFVSLIAPKNADAPSLFKWGNGFSWSYNNAMADSMKEKVKAAGGKIEGELRFSLEWFNYDDLDLHVVTPKGQHLCFSSARGRKLAGGMLDVDANAGGLNTKTPVENIIFEHAGEMQEGVYQVYVNNFSRRENIDSTYNLEIECRGEIFNFSGDNPRNTINTTPIKVTYSRKNGITVEGGDLSTTSSREIWGVSTNKFQKINMITKSPNYWGESAIGNEHLFFIIDKAHNDGDVRGFFNEFLSNDLAVHKRVFEALGGRLKVEPAEEQLSGLGFSSTQKDEVIVRVSGSFTRTLKIKF